MDRVKDLYVSAQELFEAPRTQQVAGMVVGVLCNVLAAGAVSLASSWWRLKHMPLWLLAVAVANLLRLLFVSGRRYQLLLSEDEQEQVRRSHMPERLAPAPSARLRFVARPNEATSAALSAPWWQQLWARVRHEPAAARATAAGVPIWELWVWQPAPFALSLLICFSPVHAALVWLLGAHENVSFVLAINIALSSLLYLLCEAFQGLVEEREAILRSLLRKEEDWKKRYTVVYPYNGPPEPGAPWYRNPHMHGFAVPAPPPR